MTTTFKPKNPVSWTALVLASFVFVSGLPAVPAVDITVPNVAPLVVSVTLPASLNPVAGTTSGLSSTIVVSDANGYNDITSVTVQILKPDGTTNHISASAATFSSGAALEATYTKTSNMNFYDDPATAASTYKVKVVVTDAGGLSGDNTASLGVFNYAQLVALTQGADVDFGSNLDLGTTSAIKTLSITNAGNMQIDTQVSGGAMSHATEAATIAVSNMRYSLASDMTGSAALSGSATTLTSFDLAKGAASSKNIYWQMTIPDGTTQFIPGGTYTGTMTVSAVSG